ncbi:hypothetical protein FOL47_011046 [Perkinsus chesapeaki]|uniref:Uncharacterized protein n=1 Tax=Perkinsus chesapeaki TaxID=330153 RepID=A0A7J6KYS5_PERCH|nr:hypothetical protein FOL47_011046 [Perkinsus chesapeaki]
MHTAISLSVSTIARLKYFTTNTHIFIQTPECLSGVLEVERVKIVFNGVPYAYDNKTGLINLNASTFPNDVTRFPYVYHFWELMYVEVTDEILLGVRDGSRYVHAVALRRAKNTRSLRRAVKASPTPATTTMSLFPIITTCTAEAYGEFGVRESSRVYFYDRYLVGFFVVNRHVVIYFEELPYLKRKSTHEGVEDIIPAWPSPWGFPYVDFGFYVQFHLENNSTVMVGRGGRSVFMSSYCEHT